MRGNAGNFSKIGNFLAIFSWGAEDRLRGNFPLGADTNTEKGTAAVATARGFVPVKNDVLDSIGESVAGAVGKRDEAAQANRDFRRARLVYADVDESFEAIGAVGGLVGIGGVGSLLARGIFKKAAPRIAAALAAQGGADAAFAQKLPGFTAEMLGVLIRGLTLMPRMEWAFHVVEVSGFSPQGKMGKGMGRWRGLDFSGKCRQLGRP